MNRELFRKVGSARLHLGATVVLGFVAAAVTVLQMVLLAKVVDQVFLKGAGLAGVRNLLILLLVAAVGRAVLLWTREVVAQGGAVRVKSELRGRLFAHVLRLGPAYAGGERTGELATTATEGIERLEPYFARYLPQVYLSAFIPLLVAGYILPRDLSSGILLLMTAPVIPVMMVLVGGYAEEHMQRQWTALSRMGGHFLDSLQGLPTLKVFGRSSAEQSYVAAVGEEFRRRTMKVLKFAFLSGLVLEFMTAVAIALIAVTLGVRLVSGNMAFEEAFVVLLLAPEFYRPLRELGVHRHAGMEGKAAAERIVEVLDTLTPVAGGPDNPVETRNGLTVEFSGVGYVYPGGKSPALSGVTLELPAGTRTALVGRSGSGKSTLVNLLLRFLDPDEGSITANGLPVAQMLVEDWRANLALVPQRPHLFYGEILENVWMARTGASRAEVEEAAALAGCEEFVRRLPAGYETQIGERGLRLSGGEAQRLAIARAFLKDAPLIVMDEPTSSLDPESEEIVRTALERLSEGRTVLVVAHRLNTVYTADRIAVLENGRLVEQGTHAGLRDQDGPYGPIVRGFWGIAGMKTYLRLLAFLAPYRWQVALAVFLGVATVISNVGLLATAAYVISAAAIVPFISLLTLPIFFVRLFSASRSFGRYFERLFSHDATFKLLGRVRTWFYGRLEPLVPGSLLRYRSGDLLSRISRDVEELENVYVRITGPVVIAAVAAGLVFGVFYRFFSPTLALATLAFLLAAGIGVPALVHYLARGFGRRELELRAELNAQIVDGVQGVQDLLAFGREREQQEKVAILGGKLARIQRRAAFITGLQNSLNDLLMNLAMLAALVIVIPLVAAGEVRSVFLAFIALVVLGGFEAVQPLGGAFQFLGRSLAAGERLFEIADSKPDVTDPEEPASVPENPTLEFDRVSFRYGPGDPLALEDVSFKLEAGARVAVVGPSGSGKSTLVNLALRFWDPQKGEVRLGGRDVRGYAQGDLRAGIGVLSQREYIFNDTLRQNLLLADPEADDAMLEKALDRAWLSELVERLPLGLDTYLGEQGLKLSGGERQRVAMARTFLKDAPILILDEATANLDPVVEKEVLKAARGLMQGRSTLLITHRLVDMESMDEILVLDNGQVIERGTHEELGRAGGLYARMISVQNQMLVEA